MKDSTGTVEARNKSNSARDAAHGRDEGALLEVRSTSYPVAESAETDSPKAQSSDQDTSLAEALAAKVTQLRTTCEVTRNRLKDQGGHRRTAGLREELNVSRTEGITRAQRPAQHRTDRCVAR
jgi:hypothetical protein